MRLRLIGDVHGKWGPYKKIIKDSPPSIQVGDLGLGFRVMGGPSDGQVRSNPPHYAMIQGNHRFIRGNHDNPTACLTQSQWIPDGHYENGMMFVGGAQSVDQAWRTEGYDWWKDEELSIGALNSMVDLYIERRPKIMVTHDCPEDIAEYMAVMSGRRKNDMKSRTRQAFQAMLSAHSPDLWAFGHWHHNAAIDWNGTKFVCLAELQYRDLDINPDGTYSEPE